MKKTITLIGVGIAALATIFGIITLCTMWSDTTSQAAGVCFGLAFILSLISYILAGGMGRAIKAAWGVAKTMWFLIPTFPVDICMGLVGFFLGMCMFFCLPIFFVVKSVREKNALEAKKQREAQMYYAYQNVPSQNNIPYTQYTNVTPSIQPMGNGSAQPMNYGAAQAPQYYR